MERWAKLFEINRVQVLVTTGKRDKYDTIDFTLRGPKGEMKLQLGCEGEQSEELRDFMFGDLNADLAHSFLCAACNANREHIPPGFADAFTRPRDDAFDEWLRPTQRGGMFHA